MGPGLQDRPERHVRIETLRLRMTTGDARTARSLAAAVAAELAGRAEELGAVTGDETVRVRVTDPAARPQRLAQAITGRILRPPAERQGER